jgi:hypothetical protein
MVEKKRTKTNRKKVTRKSKVTASATRSSSRSAAGKKARPAAKKRSSTATKEIRSAEPSTLSGRVFSAAGRSARSPIARSAGQAGDVQGLSRRRIADSESVEELVEEGQAREAAAIGGVEDAPDPDEAELYTREVPEDDVPEEYEEND